MDQGQYCPLCQQANQCAVNDPKACWCLSQSIPQALLDILPATAEGKVCVCARCVLDFSQDSEGFIDNYSRSLIANRIGKRIQGRIVSRTWMEMQLGGKHVRPHEHRWTM